LFPLDFYGAGKIDWFPDHQLPTLEPSASAWLKYFPGSTSTLELW